MRHNAVPYELGIQTTVLQIEEFSEKVLPKFFKHSNFQVSFDCWRPLALARKRYCVCCQSFIRQLNMYDFHTIDQVICSVEPPPVWSRGLKPPAP